MFKVQQFRISFLRPTPASRPVDFILPVLFLKPSILEQLACSVDALAVKLDADVTNFLAPAREHLALLCQLGDRFKQRSSTAICYHRWFFQLFHSTLSRIQSFYIKGLYFT
jgi:hypothetical protein